MSELICRIALTRAKGIGPITARQLLEAYGSAEALFASRNDLRAKAANSRSHLLVDALSDHELMQRAQAEADWVQQHHIDTFLFGTNQYPPWLADCADAPMVLYYRGILGLLDRSHILSVVGTRAITAYGKSVLQSIIKDLAVLVPDLVIVSGLAYGVDVQAHQMALSSGLATVGVLAHGLDRIYPWAHKSIAKDMCANGGLITEYPSRTNPDRHHFLARNRIIAGLSHATLVIESSDKGGSLITANLASSYNREVLAIPGRITDKYSEGCNKLIMKGSATSVISAQDIVNQMGWEETVPKKQTTSEALQFAPTREAPRDASQRSVWQQIVDSHPIHISTLGRNSDLSISALTTILFELEMDGYVQTLAGNRYTIA